MKYKILLIFISLGFNILSNKAKALLSEEIVGGHVANPGEFKYQVAILADGEYECGGGILDENLIAAAAHCIVNNNEFQFHKKSFKVIVTSNYLFPSQTVASALVEKVYLHKEFNVTSIVEKSIYETEEDFMILKLKTRLGISTNPLLKKLQVSEIPLHPQNSYIIAGHGYHYLADNGTYLRRDGKLRYAEVEILSNDACNTIYEEFIPHFFLCARTKQIPGMTRGVCKGDSGSPLVLNGEIIIGVLILHPITCSEDTLLGIYMRISHYSLFIENAKRGDTSNMRVFSIVGNTSSGYSFIEDLPISCRIT